VDVRLDAEFIAMKNGWVVLRDTHGKSFEFAFENFSDVDQQFLKALGQSTATLSQEDTKRSNGDYSMRVVDQIVDETVILKGPSELHITGNGEPLRGSSLVFTSPDAWLFFDRIQPSAVGSKLLDQMVVKGVRATLGLNVRIVQYGVGSVVIPHQADYPAMTLFDQKSLSGRAMNLTCFTSYGGLNLGAWNRGTRSFILKRGYMATLAENADGTGVSRNFVAQDHDVVMETMPEGLDAKIGFIRIFPWRWTSKKGVAGGIWQHLNVGWFYDWNIGANSSPNLEYVAIKQKRDWPNLDQNWQKKGVIHLLGYNEPNQKDQSDLTVDQAIAGWPELMGTGLRLGSPAPSDGGLGWIYEFIDKADARKLRVDFVAIHYYRGYGNPKDARGAANQFYQFLKGVHDRVKRPLWVTEWNNGANWSKEPDPTVKEEKEAIEKMIEMLDATPFVERYAIYNWVEDVRHVQNDDGQLTPAGEVYRDQESPLSYRQPVDGK